MTCQLCVLTSVCSCLCVKCVQVSTSVCENAQESVGVCMSLCNFQEPVRYVCVYTYRSGCLRECVLVSVYVWLRVRVFMMYSCIHPGLLHCRQTLYQLSHQGSPIHDGRHSISAYSIFVRIQSVYGVLVGLCEKGARWGRAPQPLEGAIQHDHGRHPNPNLC